MKPRTSLARALAAVPITALLLSGCSNTVDGPTATAINQQASTFTLAGHASVENAVASRAPDLLLAGATIRVLQVTGPGQVQLITSTVADASGFYSLAISPEAQQTLGGLWIIEAFATGVSVSGTSGNIVLLGALRPSANQSFTRDLSATSTIVAANLMAGATQGGSLGTITNFDIANLESLAQPIVTGPTVNGGVTLGSLRTYVATPDAALTTLLGQVSDRVAATMNAVITSLQVTTSSGVVVATDVDPGSISRPAGTGEVLTARAYANGSPVAVQVEFALESETVTGSLVVSPGTLPNTAVLSPNKAGSAAVLARIAVPGTGTSTVQRKTARLTVNVQHAQGVGASQ